MLKQARDAARQTPASRNRAADFYRALALCVVVSGHWLQIAPFVHEGELEFRNVLATQPWTQYLTWLFQVMPVFFFVGGYSNAASWTAARNTPDKRRNWASQRLRRLLLPIIPPVLFWSVAAAVVFQLGVEPGLTKAASRVVTPVWFLAVYSVVIIAVPVSFAVWEKIGIWSVAILATVTIAVDLVGVGLGQGWLRWINYVPIWLAVHQLGYWWHRGDAGGRAVGLLFVLGAIWVWSLVRYAGYPLSMVLVPGEDFYNSHPPTTAMLALGLLQIPILLLLARPVNAWLQSEAPWVTVILVAQRIMTIYLWHLTAAAIVVGLSLALGGPGLTIEPGTTTWWLSRPVWIVVLVLGLLPLLAIFGRFESDARVKTTNGAGMIQASLGVSIACAGIATLALQGIGADYFPGFNWIACALILVGVILSIRRMPLRERRR